MISYISNFKTTLLGYIKVNAAFITAIIIVLLVEILIFANVKNKNFSEIIDKNKLLNIGFSYQDSSSRYVIGYKNNDFNNFDADILMVGDSSGFINVQPLIVNKYLTNHKLINFSHSITTKWDGYLSIAENQFRKNPHIKYLLIYISPNSIPFILDKKITDDENHLKNIYSGHWSYAYQIPSLYFRRDLLEKIYQYDSNGGENHLNQNIKRISNGSYDSYEKFLADNLGWVPSSIYRNDKAIENMKINSGFCDKNLLTKKQKPDLYKLLKEAKKLTDSYNIKLIIAFAPLACKASESTDLVFKEFVSFKDQNPDVYIANDFINTRSANDFVDNDHLNVSASTIYSKEFGRRLEEVMQTIK